MNLGQVGSVGSNEVSLAIDTERACQPCLRFCGTSENGGQGEGRTSMGICSPRPDENCFDLSLVATEARFAVLDPDAQAVLHRLALDGFELEVVPIGADGRELFLLGERRGLADVDGRDRRQARRRGSRDAKERGREEVDQDGACDSCARARENGSEWGSHRAAVIGSTRTLTVFASIEAQGEIAYAGGSIARERRASEAARGGSRGLTYE